MAVAFATAKETNKLQLGILVWSVYSLAGNSVESLKITSPLRPAANHTVSFFCLFSVSACIFDALWTRLVANFMA
jgi:hypothetical protein